MTPFIHSEVVAVPILHLHPPPDQSIHHPGNHPPLQPASHHSISTLILHPQPLTHLSSSNHSLSLSLHSITHSHSIIIIVSTSFLNHHDLYFIFLLLMHVSSDHPPDPDSPLLTTPQPPTPPHSSTTHSLHAHINSQSLTIHQYPSHSLTAAPPLHQLQFTDSRRIHQSSSYSTNRLTTTMTNPNH